MKQGDRSFIRRVCYLFLLPVLPLITGGVALFIAFRGDSIRDFFPTLWLEWREMTTTWLAQHTFWPEAGWCWHFEVDETETEPGGPWMTWRKRFVWRDPVEAGRPGWTWNLQDAAYAAREYLARTHST